MPRTSSTPPARSRIARYTIAGREVEYYAVRIGRSGTRVHASRGGAPFCGSARVRSSLHFTTGPVTCEKCARSMAQLARFHAPYGRPAAPSEDEYSTEWRLNEALAATRPPAIQRLGYIAYGRDYNASVHDLLGCSLRDCTMIEQCPYETPHSQTYRLPDRRIVKRINRFAGDEFWLYATKQAHDAHKRQMDRLVPDPETGRRAALYASH